MFISVTRGFRLLSILFVSIITIHNLMGQPITAPLTDSIQIEPENRIENAVDKKIMIFTPHPDDETFAMGGTIARLAKNRNDIQIVIFTNDNKGSKDLSMTREKLARIRRAEEEKSCEILGVSPDKLHWLGYEDGDLEYADPHVLRGKIARLIKLHRPDVVFSPDPGGLWVQWHKTDHRMAANITQDAFIAAEWHLYYPQHYLDEKLEPYSVPEVYYYYSQEPNYEIDVTPVFDLKIKASTVHVSQFEPSTSSYNPEMPPEVFKAINDRFRILNRSENGLLVERFRKG